eukprot:3786836-Rhodomonas_salina.4
MNRQSAECVQSDAIPPQPRQRRHDERRKECRSTPTHLRIAAAVSGRAWNSAACPSPLSRSASSTCLWYPEDGPLGTQTREGLSGLLAADSHAGSARACMRAPRRRNVMIMVQALRWAEAAKGDEVSGERRCWKTSCYALSCCAEDREEDSTS